MKPKEFKVKKIDDFQLLVDNKDFRISEAIVIGILRNLKSKRKNIHLMSVKCTDENSIFDITLEKSSFVVTLQDNLKYYEKREMYEECEKINESIKYLESIKIK
jgi:hypothetical protein